MRNAYLEPLAALPRMGTGIGLHRMLELCTGPMEGSWYAGIDAVKVTGSNGKGSVCAMTASILRAAGVETALYTSPHLFDFRERIAVGDAPISARDLAAAVAWFEGERRDYEQRHPGDRVGAFEAATAIALRHFARAQPEALVAEAGIGGRYDPTRLFPGRLSALTSLDLEHTALLGGSLEEIAYDKADVAAEGTCLVAGALSPEIQRRLAAYARLRRLDLIPARAVCLVRRAEVTAAGTRLDLELDGRRWDDVELALLGEHQVENARLAVVLAALWLGRHRQLGAAGLEAAVRRGLAAARWPCRLEKVRTDPDVWVDAGHTPAAIDALAAAAGRLFGGRRVLLVTGASHDKQVKAVVSRLAAVASEVIATRAHHKGAPPLEVAAVVAAASPGVPLTTVATIEGAVAVALEKAARGGMTVMVAGGLFLAAEAAEVLRGGDPKKLWFL